MRRAILSIVVGIVVSFATFIIFNIAYIKWAVWRYPHHNSMAGLAAFLYGLPVGAICGIIAFCFVFFYNTVGPWPNNKVAPRP
jgi:tetrahydromethanopterin S-methyltransferase subunit E